MPLIIGIIILVVVAIILTKCGVGEGVITGLLVIIAKVVLPVAFSAFVGFAASGIVTPFVGVPLGVLTFIVIISALMK